MERVKTLRVYNLLNANGERLRLALGYTADDHGPTGNGNAGWRWSFEGKNIPMPVRSRTWFCGFPEDTMISWLKGNGWCVQTRVDMGCGYAEVYELPDADDNGNKIPLPVDSALIHAVRLLWDNNLKVKAAPLYKYIKGGTLYEATEAVKEIVDRQV